MVIDTVPQIQLSVCVQEVQNANGHSLKWTFSHLFYSLLQRVHIYQLTVLHVKYNLNTFVFSSVGSGHDIFNQTDMIKQIFKFKKKN